MEYSNFITHPLATFLLGFAASTFTTYFNNRHQTKRDAIRYCHEKDMKGAERAFNAKNEHKKYLIDTIKGF